jgi:Ca2+-binding EF-hand superfamily protein
LDFDKLNKNDKRANAELAFDVAEKHLGIAKLLDVEDLVDISKPDERSVMTYVAQYFHAFSALDKVEVAGRRVGKFANVAKSVWELRNEYERRARTLLHSISDTQAQWGNSTFDDTYANAKQQSNALLEYKNTTKRGWVTEKRALDTLLSNIQTKLKTYNLSPYSPPAELQLSAVDAAWSGLLSTEAQRRKAINDKISSIKQKLRKNYAQLANQYETDLNAISTSLGLLDGDLKGQLATVQQISGRLDQLKSSFAGVKDADAQCVAAGIDETDRDDTVYSVDDLEFDLELVNSAVTKKAQFIENQIVARNMTNVTPQQLEEFESTFRAFDKDNSNALALHEFKACMASLGKAYDDAELAEVFKKVAGGSDRATFEQFTNFMVSITEDRVTLDQLRQSFKAIANGRQRVTEQEMRAGQIPADVVEYLKTVVPSNSEGYDYEAYLKNVFA